MILVIDRIEEGIAVCETEEGALIRMPVPAGAREGDVLRKTLDGFQVDPEETRRRREIAVEKSLKIKGRRR